MVISPCRDAFCGGSSRDVVNDDAPGTNDRPRADGATGDGAGPNPEQGSFPDPRFSCEVSSRSDMDKITDRTIVVDAASRVEDRMPAHSGFRLDDGTGKDHRPLANADPRGQMRGRMDGGGPGDPIPESPREFGANSVISNGNDG